MDLRADPTEPSVTELTTVLDGRWADLRRRLREHFATLDVPDTTGLSTEEHRTLVLEQLREMAGTDAPRLGFASEFGGGGDIGGSVVAFEMLGFGDLSLMVKAGVQWGLFGGAVQLLGTRRHHERYLADIMDLSLLGCFAMTETGHGSDVQHLRTTATYDPATEEFVVHTPDVGARKDYIGNAARDGRMAVVFAQLVTGPDQRQGVHALLVPIRDTDGEPCPGVSIVDCGRKGGLNGVDNGRITFDHVRVPREALLDRYGQVAADGTYTSSIEGEGKRFFTMIGTLIRGRISVAGSAGSATQRALAIAVRHAEQRRQFRRPGENGENGENGGNGADSQDRENSQSGQDREVTLLDYLAHQRRLLPALATTYALHFAQEELVADLDTLQAEEHPDEQRQRELESRTAGIKAVTTWHATATIQTCREACGGAGYLAANVLTGLKADTDVFTTFEGDNTVLLQLVAKGLLTNYRAHFADLGTLATARFVAEQFVGAAIERTAARSVIERLVSANPTGDDLFDRAWHVRAFEDRETHVLDGLARRLRRAATGGVDPFDVFNGAQDHVLRAARVHTDRVVLEAFVAAIDRCADPATRALLARVCDLYVLSNIDGDLAWFLGHGRLTAARGKLVNDAVNTLCQELRPHATTLVDAFAIPARFLRAEMFDDTRPEADQRSATSPTADCST